MISNSQIQRAWVSKLKGNATITSQPSGQDIRENMWKGTDFAYPNIRVKMGNLTPQVDSKPCQIFHSLVSILVFSTDKSSKQADDIAGVIATEVWGKAFTSEGIKFVNVSLEALVPADVPEDNENLWVSEVRLNCLVQAA